MFPKIGGVKPPKWMGFYSGKNLFKMGWFWGEENPLFSENIHFCLDVPTPATNRHSSHLKIGWDWKTIRSGFRLGGVLGPNFSARNSLVSGRGYPSIMLSQTILTILPMLDPRPGVPLPWSLKNLDFAPAHQVKRKKKRRVSGRGVWVGGFVKEG